MSTTDFILGALAGYGVNNYIKNANASTCPPCPSCPPCSQTANYGLPLMGYYEQIAYWGWPREDTTLGIADGLVNSGLSDLGYKLVYIEEAFANSRDSNGNLQPNSNFPDGFKYVSDYLHSKGLLFGLYTDAGTASCAGLPASFGHEQQDANQFTNWGVDFLMEDQCNVAADPNHPGCYDNTRYLMMLMRYYLPSNIIFNQCMPMQDWICYCGKDCLGNPYQWDSPMDYAQMYRIGWDDNNWDFIQGNIETASKWWSLNGPNHHIFLDALHIGNPNANDTVHNPPLTLTQQQTQFSMYCIIGAPLLTTTDTRNMTSDTLRILGNTELIAVDQDPLQIGGKRLWYSSASHNLNVYCPTTTPDQQIWYKPLVNNERAVALYNPGNTSVFLSVNFWDLRLPDTVSFNVRDLWTHTDLGSYTKSYGSEVPANDCIVLKISKP